MDKLSIKKTDLFIIVLFLVSVYSLLIDLTYAGYINWQFLVNETFWIDDFLSNIGFVRDTALNLLQGSLGMTVTMVTFVLNLSVSFFSHSEHKIFGISWGELQPEELYSGLPIYRWFQNIGICFPLFIVLAINLEFCGISYMLLLSSYVVIYLQYSNLKKSYDKNVQRECVARKVLGYVEEQKHCVDDNITYLCAALENVRTSILKTEGWNNAWLLFDVFLARIMEFDSDKCYIISGYFFEVIFEVPTEKNVREELIFVKKYIGSLGTGCVEEKEDIILWSLLCSVVLQWDSCSMKIFLEWFTGFAKRSSQRVLVGNRQLKPSEIQRQSAEILIMLEYWMYMHRQDADFDCICVNLIYEHAKVFFAEENEECESLIQIVDRLYEKKYCVDGQKVYNAARAIYNDIRYHLNNTMVLTKLKYELWEKK